MSQIERLPPKGRVRYAIQRDPEALADAAAAVAAEALREAVAAAGAATFIATGGSTPGPIYERLSRLDLPWSQITVTLSDERWVDPASADSNERMVRERLLQGHAAAAQFVPLMGAGASLEQDAAAASLRLQALPGPADLLFLGMGDDGHIASLFPGSLALAQGLDPDGEVPCIAVPTGEGRAPDKPRLSLTLPWLRSARRIVLVFTGSRKFDVLEAALAASDPHLYPVRAILGAPAGVQVICAS